MWNDATRESCAVTSPLLRDTERFSSRDVPKYGLRTLVAEDQVRVYKRGVSLFPFGKTLAETARL